MEQERTDPEVACTLIGTTPTCPGARPVSTTKENPDSEFIGSVDSTGWCQFCPAWWKSQNSEKTYAQATGEQTITRQSLLQQCFCTIKGMFR